VTTDGFGPRVAFYIGDIPISETVTVTWFIIAILTIFSIVATRNMKKVPKGLQIIVETIVSMIENWTKSTMGERNAGFAPYVGTVIMFIGVSNIIGLIGLRPPTADLNTTFCFSILTFVLTQFFGLKTKGPKMFAKSFFEPMAFLFPINLIGEIANPVSLAFRLFGNIIAGVIIMNLVYSGLGSLTTSLLGISAPLFSAGIPAFMHMYFDLFSGLLQSFIFTMLTMVFISGAMAEE